MPADYYELLGVSHDASTDEVKRAYRRLARRYHPDLAGTDPEAETRFKEITVAYETLRDPDKRRRYDMFGPDGVEGVPVGDPFGGTGFADLFESIFGSDPFRTRRARSGPARGPDAEVRMALDFEEAVFGTAKPIELRLPVDCDACGTSGCRPGTYPQECRQCGGTGEVRDVRRSILGQLVTARPCTNCGATGREIRSPCPECGGEGRVTRLRRLEVDVPAGIDDGQQLRLGGRGPAAPRGGVPGDLYVTINVRPHPGFERQGEHLRHLVRIGYAQAVLGATVKIGTLDGEEDLTIPPGTRHGQVFRLRGRGVPVLHGRGRGDLLIEVEIEVPERVSPEEEALLRRLAEVGGEEVSPPDQGFLSRLRSAFQ